MKERSLQRIPVVHQCKKPIAVICARGALQNFLDEVENYAMSAGYQ